MIHRTTALQFAAILAVLTVFSGCQQTMFNKTPRWPWSKDATVTRSTSLIPPATQSSLQPEQKADMQIVLASGLERQGKLDEATAMYLKAIEADPSRFDAHHRLALLYERQGNCQEAEVYYRRAFELDGENANLHCDIGYSHYLQQRWAEAEASLRYASQLEPGLRRAHNILGLVLARTGREQEAFDQFVQAGCNRAEAHSNIAFALSLSNRWNDAEIEFQRALQTDPNLPTARSGLRSLQSLLTNHQPAGPKFNQPVAAKQVSLTTHNAPVSVASGASSGDQAVVR